MSDSPPSTFLPGNTPASQVGAAAATLCPYCGHRSLRTDACDRCRGLFEPLSRQATQNSMGPWFIRDEGSPFRPGCSYATLSALIARGRVGLETVLRGPTTHQFWTPARNVPGVASLLGECHACHQPVNAKDPECRHCGVIFEVSQDRQFLGLSPKRLLPGHATPAEIARHAYAEPEEAAPRNTRGQYELSLPPAQSPAPPAHNSYDAQGTLRSRAFEASDAAGALLAERRRVARASTRMTILGVLIGIGLLGLVSITLLTISSVSAANKAASGGASPSASSPGVPAAAPR